MTEQHVINPLSTGVDYPTLAARFRPIFQRIAEGALEREQRRTLPHEPIQWLKAAGFGAVRVPVEYGGGGASLPQLFELLIELAEADSNVPQALRGHFAFAEDRLNAPPSAGRDLWFKRFVEGDIVGCAWTEIGNVAIGDVVTQVSPDGDHWKLNGEKFYSTGSIFADWIDVYAQRSDTGADVIAATRARQPGVVHSDDWDGFGQRTTGSGSVVFDNVLVAAQDVIPFQSAFERPTPVGPLAQILHAAIDTGIARAAFEDALHFVRTKTRPWIDATSDIASEDPLTLKSFGHLSVRLHAAEALLERAGEFLDSAQSNPTASTVAAASIAVAEARAISTEISLAAGSTLFELAGSQATLAEHGLDRHWRNARVHTLHDPVRWKYHAVGNYYLNDANPPLRGTI